AGRLQDVHGPGHVRVDERLDGGVRVRDRDQGREMEGDLDALRRPLDEAPVADVAEADVDRGPRRGTEVVEPAGRAARVVDAERPDPRALPDEALDEMAADEAVGAGDEHRHVTEGSGRGERAHVS